MPELPEVETIARGLDRMVRGRAIVAVDIAWERSVDAASLPLRTLLGARILRVTRVGKFLAFDLDDGRTLTVHLRMTGRMIVSREHDPIPYERLALRLDDGSRLAFGDTRKFGRVRLLEGDPRRALGIGLEPLAPSFDHAAFSALVRRRTTPIKTFLLDQRRIAGIGNIYANEALFKAGVRPRRRAGRLTDAQRRRLLKSIRAVLQKAIRYNGSSVDDYVDAEGLPGSFQKLLSVYGRAGQPCRRCRTPIKRIVLGQRSTFFCPVCQQ